MCSLRYGDRLDKFDYERLGVKENWSPRGTILLLTSFEMETKGYYDRKDAAKAYDTIYFKYHEVVLRPLFKKIIDCWPGPEKQDVATDGIDMDRAMFSQDAFWVYLEEHNKAGVDIARLKRVLMGQESPETTAVGQDVPFQKENAEEMGAEKTKSKNHGFRFEKRGAAWILEYEDIKLSGVKDWVGLGYIKHLLQNPGKKIGVLDLQRLVGDVQLESEGDPSAYGHAEDASCGGVKAWEELDDVAKAQYRKRLEIIKTDIKIARKNSNKDAEEALLREAELIQYELKQSSFRAKDPEIETNRKRVCKVINDAMERIKKLEEFQNYNHRPLSAHLKRYIKKGSFCSYCIEDEELPPWRF